MADDPGVHLVQLERSGDVLGRALQHQIVTRAATLPVQELVPLEREHRQVRQHLDGAQLVATQEGAALE
jgi:hypothetical protein